MNNVSLFPNCVNRGLYEIRTNAQLITDVDWRIGTFKLHKCFKNVTMRKKIPHKRSRIKYSQ